MAFFSLLCIMAHRERLKNEAHRVLPALCAAGGRTKSRQHAMCFIFQTFGMSHSISGYLTNNSMT